MCLLWGTKWTFISQKTTFFIVTAVDTSYLHMIVMVADIDLNKGNAEGASGTYMERSHCQYTVTHSMLRHRKWLQPWLINVLITGAQHLSAYGNCSPQFMPSTDLFNCIINIKSRCGQLPKIINLSLILYSVSYCDIRPTAGIMLPRRILMR
jgi:hypothetical protein